MRNRESIKEKLLGKVQAYDEKDKEMLNKLIKEISDNYKKDEGLFWYVSSGLDPHPFYHFPDIHTFLYSDYSIIWVERLYEVYKKNTLSIGSLPTGARQEWLWSKIKIDKIVPINIFSENEITEIKREENYYAKENLEKIISQNLPQGFVIKAKREDRGFLLPKNFLTFYRVIKAKREDREDYEFVVLFLSFENKLVFKKIIEPFGVRLKYLCTFCDGCRKGGNWECSNNEDSEFFQTIIKGKIQPRYWVTEHNWKKNRWFTEIVREIEIQDWPDGYPDGEKKKCKIFKFQCPPFSERSINFRYQELGQ